MGIQKVGFDVDCGDWIYPSRDSTARTKYDIDFPLVALIFAMKNRVLVPVDSHSGISYHLNSPRYLCCEIISGKAVTDHALRIVKMKNRHEEEFKKKIDVEVQFDPRSLNRADELWPNGFENSYENSSRLKDEDWWSILFASILLQAHLAGRDLPDGITFRNAIVPEIESIGRW